MPNATVKSFAEKTGKSIKEVERLWRIAKSETSKKLGDEDHPDFYAYTTGILKKMLKIDESLSFLNELQTLTETYYENPAVAKFNDMTWVEVQPEDQEEFFNDIGENLNPDHNDKIFTLLNRHNDPDMTVFMWKMNHGYHIDYVEGLKHQNIKAFAVLFRTLPKYLGEEINLDHDVITDYPALASLLNCGKIHYTDLIELIQHPEIAKYCDLSTLDSDTWLEVLLKLPHFIEHPKFNKSKLDQEDLKELLQRQPKLGEHPKLQISD